ncbi:Uncharacterized protein Fot_54076 [Forsythia ovata]|uniref:Uncharacterized protein n=1 Tax=Forsythia ovata TaxID=205694 RepID=A0ABD1PGQ0_9LAMI
MFNLNFYLKTLISCLRNPNLYPCISLLHSPPSKKSLPSNPAIQLILDEAQDFGISKPSSSSFQTNLSVNNGKEILPHKNCGDTSKIQISHPWPEWVDLMEKQLKNEYFKGIGDTFGSKCKMGTKEANLGTKTFFFGDGVNLEAVEIQEHTEQATTPFHQNYKKEAAERKTNTRRRSGSYERLQHTLLNGSDYILKPGGVTANIIQVLFYTLNAVTKNKLKP